MKKSVWILFLFLTICLLTACTFETDAAVQVTEKILLTEDQNLNIDVLVIAQDETTVTILDARGNQAIINKHPQRVIPMQITLLDLWYLAGGEAVARTSAHSNIPENARDLPEVGTTTTPNIELVLAAQPDLVILNATSGSHVEMAPILAENDIQYFFTGTSLNPYQSIMQTLYLFATITENQEAYDENAGAIQEGVSDIIAKTDGKESPTVLILFGSSKTIRCELENGLVGDMVKRLGGKNIIDVKIDGESKVEFSLERIIEQDPDYILVSVMGDLDTVQDKLNQDIGSNAAWSSLTAVKEGNVYFLPMDIYMYKPNARYPEAFQGLFDILYPEE